MRKSRVSLIAIGIFAALVYTIALVPDGLAQSAFTGVVRDQSGAVLPGVAVEASSPVRIEKSSSTVRDERGTNSIINLSRSTYSL